MQPAEFFLDEILKKLQLDRVKPVSEREHLNADIVLREIIKTDRHEDFLEMIQILKEDGMIRRVNESVNHLSEIDKSRDVLITVKGSLFIESGGYTKQKQDKIALLMEVNGRNQRMERNEENLVTWTKNLTQRTKDLTFWTRLVAIGAIGLVVWEIAAFTLEHNWFSCY